jgi:FKBP-type peptidyl-prolyl cis-trans isomerase
METKGKKIIGFLIVIVVVAVLVFITIKNKGSEEMGQNSNMENKIEGINITVLQEGAGSEAKAGDTVAMNYTGKFADGTSFDSNVDPKFNHVQPFVFTLGAGQVIKGWDLGIAGMKPGEKRVLEIAPELAYGSNGVGGVIPPNSTLTFEVELLAIRQ